MKIADREAWLDKHGLFMCSVVQGMHRIDWMPTYGTYTWTRYADTYVDALDTLFGAIKDEMYYYNNDHLTSQ